MEKTKKLGNLPVVSKYNVKQTTKKYISELKGFFEGEFTEDSWTYLLDTRNLMLVDGGVMKTVSKIVKEGKEKHIRLLEMFDKIVNHISGLTLGGVVPYLILSC